MSSKREMHVLLGSELEEHRKILAFFGNLPKVLREHIQTFYRSTLPMLMCPECGSGYYKLNHYRENELTPLTNCFLCEHNYFQLKFATHLI